MGEADYFSPGDWNIICSICGSKMKFSQAVQNWQGQYRHPHCNEPRHPQDFVQAIKSSEMAIPVPQNMGEIDILICTLNGTSAVSGLAVAGCMVAGNSNADASVWAGR